MESRRIPIILRKAGVRYWTASLLPALVGTTLPFWLRPPGFSFRGLSGLEFLAATLLVHSGFSFLQSRLEDDLFENLSGSVLLGMALGCLALASILGLHLARSIPGPIFLVFGCATLFAGLLYVIPPPRLSQRPGGEVVGSISLTLLPVLGAYLVQTGDLTRRVYLAALPIYAATGLWVWIEQLADDSRLDRPRARTLIHEIGLRASGSLVVPLACLLLLLAVGLAVLSRSVSPFSLVALLLSGMLWQIVSVCRRSSADLAEMQRARTGALLVHSGVCLAIVLSSIIGRGP